MDNYKELLQAKRDFDRVVNRTERSAKQAAKSLQAMLDAFDAKYGPTEKDLATLQGGQGDV